MHAAPKISETEWELMRVIWSRHPITAAELIEHLNQRDPSWHPKTVRTLLARLVRKKALSFKSDGRAYVYEPLVGERECVAAASESFVERVLGGSLKPILSYFVEQRHLSKAELEELRRFLEKAGGSRARHPDTKRKESES